MEENNNQNPNIPEIPESNIPKNTEEALPVKEEPKEKTGSGKKLFLGFIVTIVGLFSLFYTLLLVALLNGDISNPLFETIGFDAAGLKSGLLLITNSIFGFISLVFLISSLVKFFQWLIAPKDAYDKKQKLKSTGVYSAILLVSIGIWVTLFWVISNANVKTTPGENETLIITEPVNTIGLTSPRTVKFDIGENLFKQISPELIRQIDWDFDGDGVFDASGPNVTYEFLDKGENNGRYNVQVSVTYFAPDTKQEKKYTDGKDVIIANEAVIADISANPLSGQAPLAVNLSARNSRDPDGAIVLYEWDLDGDNSYEIRGKEKADVSTVFNTIGEHIVRLRVTGRNNDFATSEVEIAVNAPDEKIRAQITSKDSSFKGLAPLEITLDGAQSFTKEGRIVKYEWQVEGEERSVLSRKIQRTFDREGEYKITLTVENEDGEKDQSTETISVFEKSEVIITTNPKANEENNIIEGVAPFEVVFDSSNSAVPRSIEWQWDFNNDDIVDEFAKKTTHTFGTPGLYETELTIIDSDNKSHTKIQKIRVLAPGLLARIKADPSSGESPVVVHFDGSGSSSSEGEIINYIWKFPNLDPIYSSAKISKEFTQVGTFPISLTIVTDSGETHTTEKLISVRAQIPEARFNFSPRGGDAPLEVSFNPNASTGNIVQYYWSFGDGSTSNNIRPTHTYQQSGTYSVKLRITDVQGLVSDTEETIVID